MQSNEYRFEAMLAYNQAWYHGNTWKHGTNLQPAPDRHYRVQSSSSLAHTQNTSSSQTLVSTFLWFRQLDTMIVFFSLSFFSLSLSLCLSLSLSGQHPRGSCVSCCCFSSRGMGWLLLCIHVRTYTDHAPSIDKCSRSGGMFYALRGKLRAM